MGGQGSDEGGGGVGGIPTGEFQHVSVYIFQKFKHTKLVHCHHQRSFNLKVDLLDEAWKDSLLRGWGDVGGHKAKMGVLEICVPESVKRGTDVEKGVDGEGECGGTEIVGELFDVTGVGEVITEGVGVKGNGHGVNRSRYCSQRDRRETIRRGRGRTPSCLRSSRRRPRSIIDDRRRKRQSGRNSGCIIQWLKKVSQCLHVFH